MQTIEPHLIPIEAERFQQKGNNANKARLDIAARVLWSTFERILTDVRIFKHWPSSTFSKRIKRKGSISIEFYR